MDEFGIIYISIGDDENSKLKCLLENIFSNDDNNFQGNLIWRKRKGGGNDSFFVATDHEYILFFKKKSVHKKKLRIPYEEEYLKRYREEDEIGRFYWDTLSRPGLNHPIIFDVTCPDGTIIKKVSGKYLKKNFITNWKVVKFGSSRRKMDNGLSSIRFDNLKVVY